MYKEGRHVALTAQSAANATWRARSCHFGMPQALPEQQQQQQQQQQQRAASKPATGPPQPGAHAAADGHALVE